MSYEVFVDQAAWDELIQYRGRSGIPAELITCIGRHLEALGQDPWTLGTRPDVPFPPRGLVYYFSCDVNGVRHNLAALFRFEEEEYRALRVKAIRYDSPDE